MHYYALVITPPGTTRETANDAVDPLMLPHIETWPEDPEADLTGFWDWWVVGGRYTGRLSGYDPTTDRKNLKVCWLCHGTGKRDDKLGREIRSTNPAYGCNGCDDTGFMIKFSSDWAPHDEDVLPVSEVMRRELPPPYTLLTPDGEALHADVWDGHTIVDTPRFAEIAAERLLPLSDHVAVVVDYHC